jgi:hypothetical protein
MFQLPAPIPPAGQRGGPPPESDRKIMWGMPFDARAFAIDVERHPDRLIPEMDAMGAKFQQMAQKKK